MAIMAVTRGQQQQPREKKDWTDDLLKGLQIASGAFGIATNVQQMGLMDLQKKKYEEDLKRSSIEAQQDEAIKQSILPAKLESAFTPTVTGDPYGMELTNERTGEKGWYLSPFRFQAKMADIAKTEKVMAETAAKEAGKIKTANEAQKDWGDIFRKSKITLNTEDKLQNFLVLQNGWKGGTGADDLAMIYAYAKMLDPGSVVREGEITILQKTASIPSWLMARYKRVTEGGALDPTMRNEIYGAARQNMVSQLELQEKLVNKYVRQGVMAHGGNPAFVIPQYYDQVADDLGLKIVQPQEITPLGGGMESKAYGAPAQNLQDEVNSLNNVLRNPKTSKGLLP